jgi:hypothetical protein
VIDPMLVILAPPALVFSWAMVQMHRGPQEPTDAAPGKVEASR